jgi:hypothetical protein
MARIVDKFVVPNLVFEVVIIPQSFPHHQQHLVVAHVWPIDAAAFERVVGMLMMAGMTTG